MRTTPRPPLTKRLRRGHWVALDFAVGAIFGLVVFAGLFPHRQDPGVDGGRLQVLAFGLGIVLAIGLRRYRPGLFLLLLLAGSVLATDLFRSAATPIMYAPAAYVLYLVVANYETRRELRRTFAAIAVTITLNTLLVLTTFRWPEVAPEVPGTLCLAIAWILGYNTRQRRDYAVGLQVEAASKAVAEERLRIARELHDIVAHSMSVIAVQAGYGQYVIDAQPADARNALSAIQSTSREALDEMRRMLGALRQADEAAAKPAAATAAAQQPAASSRAASSPAELPANEPVNEQDRAGFARVLRQMMSQTGAEPATAAAAGSASAPLYPAPGLADLDRLITRTQGAGVQVRLTVHGARRELPAGIDLSAYRMIQESLTNVVKHAHTRACDVVIGYQADELLLKVTDGGSGMPEPAIAARYAGKAGQPATWGSSGHGITGMRERISLLGGEFRAGPLPGYGFQVSARIPLPASP